MGRAREEVPRGGEGRGHAGAGVGAVDDFPEARAEGATKNKRPQGRKGGKNEN